VAVSPRDRRFGWLFAGHMRVRCALGRSGTTRHKREGDGATPVGSFALLQMFYRPDKGPRPRALLPARTIRPDDGWCDAPQDRAYNTLVKRPYPASHEEMWRGDDMYDLVVDIDYNRGRGPALPGRPLRPSSMSSRPPSPTLPHEGGEGASRLMMNVAASDSIPSSPPLRGRCPRQGVEGGGGAKQRLAKQVGGGIRKGKGSAIFMHVVRPGFTPTAGCVALHKGDLRRLLRCLGPRTRIVIA